MRIYQATKDFPREETYGLTSQRRRAAASIPANIAEGQGGRFSREFQQFLADSSGSLLELDTHLELAFRGGYFSTEQHYDLQQRCGKVDKILNGLMRSLDSKTNV